MINIAQGNETVTSVAGIGLVGGSCANAPNWRQAPEQCLRRPCGGNGRRKIHGFRIILDK